jgi:hypothetical protein
MTLPRLEANRYVQPLREGGSLPGVVDTHEGGLYVVKFRGAGQGAKVLLAELIVGRIAEQLELPVPPLALVEISPRFGRSEPDPEIQDLLRRSHGVNVGMRYLEGAFNFDPQAAGDLIAPELAARVVWLDAFTTNPDRTHRNPNLLIWNRAPWLIDHGAALYAHHDWASVDEARTRSPFQMIRSHVLLSLAGDLAAADEWARTRIDEGRLREVVRALPDELLMDTVAGAGDFPSATEGRERYLAYLVGRLAAHDAWMGEAIRAQEQQRLAPPQHLKARR